MKICKTIEEVEKEGLLALIGVEVILFCLNYIYIGQLIGVNDTCVKLEDASIVYETGPTDFKKLTDAEKLPGSWYVQVSAIESFGTRK